MKHTKIIASVLPAAVLTASFSGCSRFIADASSIFEETYEISYAGERSIAVPTARVAMRAGFISPVIVT